MQKFIWYVRVSSAEQAERNISIPSQIDQIHQYATNNQINISNIFKEEHSAYKGKRQEFQAVLKELRNNKTINGLIVFKYDRISRNMEDFLEIEKIVKERSIEIISVTEPMLNSYLWRYMIRDMQNRAILYSEELSFRIKLGMRKKLQLWWDIWWSPPFWFKRVNWYLIPDEEKAKLVRYIYQTYSYGELWCIEISRNITKKFWIYIGKSNIDRILTNKLYLWIKEKKWKVWHEEYIFRWLEKPWEYIESYKLWHITPIISDDLFERCQNIRKGRYLSSKYEKSWTMFPRIFECWCGRRIRRDDKKGIKYLRCTNHVNNKHLIRCWEPYMHLEKIEKKCIPIIEAILPSITTINDMIMRVHAESKLTTKGKNNKLQETLQTLDEHQTKLRDITQAYLDSKISKDLFESSGSYITQQIDTHTALLKSLEADNSYAVSYKKVIEFLEVLKTYRDKLESYQNNKKSSQLFSLLFKCVANLTITWWNISNHLYNSPFDILKNSDFSDWWRWWDSNPRLKVMLHNVYHHRYGYKTHEEKVGDHTAPHFL